MIPAIITKPSFPIKPKEIINTPSPGMKLERGIGIKTKLEKISAKNPTIFCACGVIIKERRGRMTRSALRIHGADFCTNIARTDLFTDKLENFFGNFGAENPRNICDENKTSGIEIMLGKGGGVGMIRAKEKIIMIKPKPIDSIALTISRMGTRSEDELLTTSSRTCVVRTDGVGLGLI
jgi:hypothetical protein